MSVMVPIALFGWPIVTLALFMVLSPARAVLASVIGGELFLPIAGYAVAGAPDYTKSMAVPLSALLGVVLFDAAQVMRFRPRLIDLPMGVYCCVPFASSMANGLGPYDGITASLGTVFGWGVPYFLGRLYFTDLFKIREFAVAIVIGGLVYLPFCLIEVRLSPQFHTWIYGFHQHDFGQTRRFGGFRPTVFMEHGIKVALWMALAAFTASWLWLGRARPVMIGVPMSMWAGVLIVVVVLCKSAGATAVLVFGLGAAVAARVVGTRLAAVCIVILPFAYAGVRTAGLWSGSEMVDLARAIAGEERAGSLGFRLKNENYLIDHALKQPVFGWGAWGRNRPQGQEVVTDGLWVIILGRNGLVGFVALFGAVSLPALLTLLRLPVRAWFHPAAAGAVVMAVALGMFMIDSLFNAFPNPVYLMAAGALARGARLPSRPEGTPVTRGTPGGDQTHRVAPAHDGPHPEETPT